MNNQYLADSVRDHEEITTLRTALSTARAEAEAMREAIDQALDDMGEAGHSVCEATKQEMRAALQAHRPHGEKK